MGQINRDDEKLNPVNCLLDPSDNAEVLVHFAGHLVHVAGNLSHGFEILGHTLDDLILVLGGLFGVDVRDRLPNLYPCTGDIEPLPSDLVEPVQGVPVLTRVKWPPMANSRRSLRRRSSSSRRSFSGRDRITPARSIARWTNNRWSNAMRYWMKYLSRTRGTRSLLKGWPSGWSATTWACRVDPQRPNGGG